MVLDSSPPEVVVTPSEKDQAEFYVYYALPCCNELEYQITYANRDPRLGKGESALLHETIKNVTNQEIMKISFSISSLKVEDSGVYTIQLFMNNSNLRLILPFTLKVHGLILELPTIVEHINKRAVDGVFLTKDEIYKFSCIAKGTVEKSEFEIYWKPCYKTAECDYEKLSSDRFHTFTGPHRKEVDIIKRADRSGTFKFKFDANETELSYFVTEIKNDQRGKKMCVKQSKK